MPVPDILITDRTPPHVGPVAHGFAALGNAAGRAANQLAALAADAAQAPGRLNYAAALLTADGRLGTVWDVIAPFVSLLLGAAAVAFVVYRLLSRRRRALTA